MSGKVRAQKIMEELDISASRRVRGLGAKQRALLLEKFARSSAAAWPSHRGRLIVIAGPSGVGKGSIVGGLLARDPSARALRLGHHPSRRGRPRSTAWTTGSSPTRTFDRMIAARRAAGVGEIVGHCSGPPRAFVEEQLAAGRDVLLEIDVQGGRRSATGSRTPLLILLVPPSMEELERRLRGQGHRGRGGRSRDRLADAERELEEALWFDRVVVNDDARRAADEVAAIIEASRTT